MPTVDSDGVTLRYAVRGDGMREADPIVFVNDVGFGTWYWSYLLSAVAGPSRTVVWDLRGTGDSETPEGPYALETLVDDLERVVDAIDGRRVTLVGAGLGGAIALEYARRHEHVSSLVLLGTAEGEAVDADALASLSAPLDEPEALKRSLRAGFTPGTIESHPAEIDRIVEWRARDDADPAGSGAQRAAWLDADLPDRYEITTPALVASGGDDRIVDSAATARLAADLPRGEHRRIEGGHLFPVSQSQVVADELLAWLDERTD